MEMQDFIAYLTLLVAVLGVMSQLQLLTVTTISVATWTLLVAVSSGDFGSDPVLFLEHLRYVVSQNAPSFLHINPARNELIHLSYIAKIAMMS